MGSSRAEILKGLQHVKNTFPNTKLVQLLTLLVSNPTKGIRNMRKNELLHELDTFWEEIFAKVMNRVDPQRAIKQGGKEESFII